MERIEMQEDTQKHLDEIQKSLNEFNQVNQFIKNQTL